MKPARRLLKKKPRSDRHPSTHGTWASAFFIATVVFISLSLYLFTRRGYYNTYIVNKVFGSTAAILAALSLASGVLARWKPMLFAILVRVRRELGIYTWIFALLHVVTSLLFLSVRFPLSWYQGELIPFLAGSSAVLIWSLLALISDGKHRESLGPSLWVFLQTSGARLAFLFVLVHLVVMKYAGWIRWFQGLVKANPELAHPEYPPASLFVLAILLCVLFIRITTWLRSLRK